jgi:tetratricopeptide (TPR) repeat protein
MVDHLVGARPTEAMWLFAAIRPWLGSWSVAASQVEQIDELLMGTEVEGDSVWASAILALSATYCHAGAFKRMSETAAYALAVAATATLATDTLCQMHMQFGIAMRALDRFEEAIEAYQRAIPLADPLSGDATLVKCYYNLGALLETQERLPEALIAQESAADHFSETTDPRVESLVSTCIGRLRYRLGHDLASAGLILEATLAHARERQDKRAVGEILQNLGLIYWERKLYARAALVETAGTSLLLDFGYTGEFRRLAKSSFVTLCASLFELGYDELAQATRTLIDRLGPAELYTPNQVLFDQLTVRTYAHPAGLKFGLATEREVRSHLNRCLEQLEAEGSTNQESADILVNHVPVARLAVSQISVHAASLAGR